MRVLHVIPSISPFRGGPSKAVIEMVRALIDAGVEVEIATTNDDGANLLDVTLNILSEHQGVPVRFFERLSPPIPVIKNFAYSTSFKSWLNTNIDRYDVVHIHAIFSFTSSYAMWLARKRGVAYIVRPIGQLEIWSLQQSYLRKQLFLKLFERQNILGASAIHFTAESEKKQSLQSLPELAKGTSIKASSIKVIPLGINLTTPIENAREKLIKHYDLAANKKIILFLSRLHPKKGLELLLKSLSNIDSKKWQLLIAGDGEADYVESLKKEAKQLRLERDVQFVGFISGEHKDELLQGADLYTLTSHSENFGIAVLEALGAGTPALVSREVALSKLIESQELGYVCELNQSSICDAIQSAMTADPTLGEKAADYVAKHYQWPAIAQRLRNLYSEISK